MSFKDQLSKHENILNKYKDLYIDKKTNEANKTTDKNITFNLNQGKNGNYLINSNLNQNKINNTDSLINTSNNNTINSNLNFSNENNDNEKENLNLEKIDNLLAKLNFKRENKNLLNEDQQINQNLNNSNITQKKEITNKTNEKKLNIENIKLKYQNNEIKSLNITQKYFNDSCGNDEKSKIIEENLSLQENNNNNNYLNTINNIKKLKALNARKEIERIKAKYYFPKNIYNTSKNNLIINTTNNFDTSFNQLSKEIAEIKEKLDSYQKEFKCKNYINNEQILPKNETNISIVNSNNILFKKEEKQDNIVCNEICTNFNNENVINDCDYSEVLPILDKVSKLKDLSNIDDNFDKNNNQENYEINDEDEVPGIVSNVLDALSNKLIASSLEEIKDNKIENKEDVNKPKLISKNNNINRETKPKKILSFEEFLSKEDNNNS